MIAATLVERIYHKLGYHYYRSYSRGLIRITKRFFLMADRDLLSVTCIFCDREVLNPFHKNMGGKRK